MNTTDLEAEDEVNRAIALRWCEASSPAWVLGAQAGRGGTAPVFLVEGPQGSRALKLYDERFSTGEKGKLERKRIEQQVQLGDHACPNLIKVHEGGQFENRLYLLMDVAEGVELEKVLDKIPRDKIRTIVDQVASACQFLREKGLSHRDVKSANIFVSHDYDRAVLLDLSVMREIEDPVGIGTDHGDQLPVVATARYSPPEYLFRLEDPSPELWHGVDVYQLGGLLHDLIMQKPLFEDEYREGKENRYRFAWVVATKTPEVTANDVDQDLVVLSRRALSKDWVSRRELKLSDFRATREGERNAALAILGLSGTRNSAQAPPRTAALKAMAEAVELDLSNRLFQIGATTVHRVRGNADWSAAELTFTWETRAEAAALTATSSELCVNLEQRAGIESNEIHSRVSLAMNLEGHLRHAASALPPVSEDENAAAQIAENAFGLIGELGAKALAAK